MSNRTPQERRSAKARERLKSPQFLHALGTFVVGGGMAVAMTIYIQEKYHLYSSSTTMTLIEWTVGAVMLVVIALLTKRWYIPAWGVAVIAPPVLFFFILRLLAQHPPVPPLG